MSKKDKRLGKGLKKDYRESLIGERNQASKYLEIQKSKNLEIQKPNSQKTKKSRRQTTVYLTKQQLRAMKEIQIELLENDLKMENSEIAGLGIEILREIVKNLEVQNSENLETLKSKCLNILRKHQET